MIITPDCTNIFNLIDEASRLCHAHKEDCSICPLGELPYYHTFWPCFMAVTKDPSQYVAIVQKWSDEHPPKTWIDKLREVLPDADYGAVTSSLCPHFLFNVDKPKDAPCLGDGCIVCWNRPVKEEC